MFKHFSYIKFYKYQYIGRDHFMGYYFVVMAEIFELCD